jgi:hypothetical protein
VLTFCGEFYHGPLVEVSDFDALGKVAALLEQTDARGSPAA